MVTLTHFGVSLQENGTPLHKAARLENTALCELLIAKGANVNALSSVSDCDGERER